MTQDYLELSEAEFDERYTLVSNHLNPSAGWVDGDGPGCLFETYGDELSYIKQQDPQQVWTLIDGDDGDLYLMSGFHFVNRIGYLLSTTAVPVGLVIQVRLLNK